MYQTAMNGILEGVQTLFRNVGSRLYQDVIHGLEEMDIQLSNEQQGTIETLFESLQDPFVNLQTRHHQDKYIKDHLDYLVAKLYIIVVACALNGSP